MIGAAAMLLALLAGWGTLTRYYAPAGASPHVRAAVAALQALPPDTGVILGLPLQTDWLAIYAPLPRPAPVVAKNSVERDARVGPLLDAHLDAFPRTLFAIEYTAAGDPASLAEARLDGGAYKVGTRWLGDEVRLVEYRRAAGVPLRPVQARLGEAIVLDGAAVEVLGRGTVGDPVPVRPGEWLGVRLDWRAVGAPDKDYTVFAHVERTAEGVLPAQHDRPPLEGMRPTSAWRAGDRIVDLIAIPILPEAAPGEYDLVVGLYDPQSGARLPVSGAGPAGGDIRALPDAAVLATVQVVE